MTDKTITQLPAGTTIGDSDISPWVQGGTTVKLTAAQFAAYARQSLLRAADSLVFTGDSIATIFGQCHADSPLFWAWVSRPRLLNQEYGTLNNGLPGSPSAAVASGGTQNVQLAARNPDVNVYVTGMNDWFSDDIYLTWHNILSGVASTPGVGRNVLTLVNPAGRSLADQSAGKLGQYSFATHRTLYREYAARSKGRALFFDPWGSFFDDTKPGYQPFGVPGAAGSPTVDAIHPSVAGARIVGKGDGSSMNRMLDQLGFAVQDFPAVSNVVYSATDAPFGNLLSNGTMQGAETGALFAPATGQCATGWGNLGTDAAVSSAYSKSTISFRGGTVTAQKIVFSTTGTTSGPGSISLKDNLPPSIAGSGQVKIVVQALLEVTNLVDVTGISMSVSYYKGGAAQLAVFGLGSEDQAPHKCAANRLQISGTEQWQYLLPGYLLADAGSVISITFQITHHSGTSPSGEVKIGAVSINALPSGDLP